MNIPERLNWMSNEQWEEIHWYWSCVCDYDMHWKDEQEYEGWCKRVLKLN